MEYPLLFLLFMWMETKAQRGEGTCSKPHSSELAELELEPGLQSQPPGSPHCPSALLVCPQGME